MELRELAQVLRRGGEQELIPGTAWTTQAQPVEAQDALQMCELHLDLLAVTTQLRASLAATARTSLGVRLFAVGLRAALQGRARLAE